MRVEDLIEMASPIVYHATQTRSAYEILKSNKFRLSIAVWSQAELAMMPGNDKLFYLSTSRMRFASYSSELRHETILELDGRALSSRYSARAVDYNSVVGHSDELAGFEAEDRIYSRDPEIKNARRYIKSVHVYYMKERHRLIRRIALESLRNGIEFYAYSDTRDLLSMRKERAMKVDWRRVPDGDMSDMEVSDQKRRTNQNPFRFWLELHHERRHDRLSRDAREIIDILHLNASVYRLKSLLDDHRNSPYIRSIHNAMREARVRRVEDFVTHLRHKWVEGVRVGVY